MRLRPVLVLTAATLALGLGGATTAAAATESAEKPIDSTITLTLESVTKINPVLVVGCLLDAATTPVAPEAVLITCLNGG